MSNDLRRSPSPAHHLATQLPLWPEPVRGGPNALLRSAFFAGIHSRARKVLGDQVRPEKEPEGVLIASQDGVTIKYAGTQFNQYDADVFFQALHEARLHPLGTECLFKGGAFLTAIGRTRSKGNYEDLDDSLRRLNRGTVDVEWRVNRAPLAFTGHLIADYTRDKKNKLYKVTFSKEIRTLFAPASWTQLEWEERRALAGGPLAQWLHSYFSTHAKPFPVTVAYLKDKTGSPTARIAHFREDLRNALELMQDKLHWQVEWDGDRVTVTRPPSDSQGRHLARQAQRIQAKAALRQKPARALPAPRGEQGLTHVGDALPGILDTIREKR